jgi:hypothetical protein
MQQTTPKKTKKIKKWSNPKKNTKMKKTLIIHPDDNSTDF